LPDPKEFCHMVKALVARFSDSFRLPLKDALFLGFCAVFAVLVRVVLRLHLSISGHAMIIKVFFLMLGRASTPCRYGASFTALLAGTAAMFLGFAKAGPFIIVKYLIAGVVIDLSALFLPVLFSSYVLCALVAAVASSTKFVTAYAVNAMVGMDPVVNMQRSLLEAAGAVVFGIVGGLLIPMVVRRLRAYGVIRWTENRGSLRAAGSEGR
jgi:hypothetical protein